MRLDLLDVVVVGAFFFAPELAKTKKNTMEFPNRNVHMALETKRLLKVISAV